MSQRRSPALIIFLSATVALFLFVSILWRCRSRRLSLPCPAWLGWMVEMENPFFRNHRSSAILEKLDLDPAMTVLDFGCGPGRLTLPLARALREGGSVVAFDMQHAMLDRVRTRAESEGLSNIAYIRGEAGEGKIDRGRFDRILLVAVLGEILHREGALEEMRRGLKEEGLLCLSEVIADPHFQGREEVRRLASSAGFVERAFFGSPWAYTLLLAPSLPLSDRFERRPAPSDSDEALLSGEIREQEWKKEDGGKR